jgi:hypothetical protein
MDVSEYCRELEAYLCRKNDGHLIRIVGPAFEKVRGWAEQGIPFKVACKGIDRCVDRRSATGPRRRPVRIEFCEADVLDVFDDWRRAVGVAGPPERPEDDGERPSRSHPSLPTHLDRILLKLTSARGQLEDEGVVGAIDRAIDRIEEIRASARGLRGSARAAALAALESIDAALLDAVRSAASAADVARETEEARRELAPFAARMGPDARGRALATAVGRALLERAGLPRVRYE